MADFLSNDEVGEEDRFDKERERMQKKKRKADGRRNEIEAKQTSPRKWKVEHIRPYEPSEEIRRVNEI
jgi:hypothetical protein